MFHTTKRIHLLSLSPRFVIIDIFLQRLFCSGEMLFSYRKRCSKKILTCSSTWRKNSMNISVSFLIFSPPDLSFLSICCPQLFLNNSFNIKQVLQEKKVLQFNLISFACFSTSPLLTFRMFYFKVCFFEIPECPTS